MSSSFRLLCFFRNFSSLISLFLPKQFRRLKGAFKTWFVWHFNFRVELVLGWHFVNVIEPILSYNIQRESVIYIQHIECTPFFNQNLCFGNLRQRLTFFGTVKQTNCFSVWILHNLAYQNQLEISWLTWVYTWTTNMYDINSRNLLGICVTILIGKHSWILFSHQFSCNCEINKISNIIYLSWFYSEICIHFGNVHYFHFYRLFVQ